MKEARAAQQDKGITSTLQETWAATDRRLAMEEVG